jgi:hypothetical protein
MKVFLGGTVAGSTWREYIIPKLEIDYFNPVVDDWTEEDQKIELYEREHCDFCLYVISPKMMGWFSIAEIMDDSYKKSDKTIYCYLPKDDDKEFNEVQLAELERIGKLATANGAIWKHSLDEVVSYLNSANDLVNDVLLQKNEEINDVFISYGRRHSLAFARKLHQNLLKKDYKIWFDMNDIPLGVDFQEQIDTGIRKADNFVYVISPHSINSDYCYKELVLALKYNKRIIPIIHVEPQEQATWDKIDPQIGKRNWIYMRQSHDKALELSAKTFEIQEKILDIPIQDWGFEDDIENALDDLSSLIENHHRYVRTHTVLLDKSLGWLNDARSTVKLLVGKERQEAERFLEQSHGIFKNHTGHSIQPPCYPTDLLANFVMESKKNGNNKQSDLFICHDLDDGEAVQNISSALAKYGFSSWISSNDISKGVEYNHAIHSGVIQSANILFFISKKSLQSDYCKKEYNFALKYNKRIIPILLEEEAVNSEALQDFEGLENLQYINFTDLREEITVKIETSSDVHADVEARRSKTPFEISLGEIVQTLNDEHRYYEEHRVFLVQALRWKELGEKQSFLLRGFNFENAKTWLRLYKDREQHAPLATHKDFIFASEAAKGQLETDVFISYSRKDSDLARRLNLKLQEAGKTTWFDQESISKGVDFEKEIFNGIDACDNFVFIISPDAVASEYCEREVDYAVSQNKRILTLLGRETDTESIPKALGLINWIDFKDTEFSKSFSELIQAIEIDREYTTRHTQTQRVANEWNDQNKSPDFLLNASACTKIEKWLSEAFGESIKDIYANSEQLKSEKSPAPSSLQIEFTKASRESLDAALKKERKRQRFTLFVVTTGAMLAIAFGIFGYVQKGKAEKHLIQAEEQTKIAKEQTKKAENALEDFVWEEIQRKKVQIKSLFNDAKSYEYNNEIPHAILKLEKALAIDSTNVEVKNKLQELKKQKSKSNN